MDRFEKSLRSSSVLECVVKYIGRRDAVAIIRQLGYIPPNVKSVAAREQVPPYTYTHIIMRAGGALLALIKKKQKKFYVFNDIVFSH